MTLFTRLPEWLRDALNTQEPDVPNTLAPGRRVEAVIDIGQGGWGRHEWGYVFNQHPASSAQGHVTLVAADANRATGILVYQDCNHTGGAAPLSPELSVRDTVTGNWVSLGRPAVAVGATLSHSDIFGSPQIIVVPPGFNWNAFCPATGVGESLFFGTVFTRYRAGYKPI